MPSEAISLSSDEFLGIAVEQKLLSSDHAAKLCQLAEKHDGSISALCLEKGLLKPVQIDVIYGLAERDNLAPGYEVIDLLGYGGLGIVFRARQPKLDRMVALKTIPMQRIENPSVIARFQQEAKAIGKLKHPNIVAAYDYGTHRERVYLAMELVEGRDVDALIDGGKPIGESLAWSLAQQVAAGLAHAAQHNLVHRDIKPGNLLLTKPPAGYPLPAGVPLLKITDFGLVQLEAPDTEGTRLTMGGTSLGTPHYMAPEQVADAHVDSRADIYALGATVFHILAGRPPFEGTSIGQVLAAKLKGEQKWLDRLPEGTSPATVELLKRMMAQDPANRIGDYDTLLKCIQQVLSGELPAPNLAAAETVDGLLISDTSIDGLLTEESLEVPSTRTRWPSVAALAAVIVVSAGFYFSGGLGEKHSLPPTQLEASREVQRPLFNGLDLNGWTAIRGGWKATEDDMHSKVMAGKGAITRELPGYLTSPDEPLEHFGVRLKIDLHTASSAEIHFEHEEHEQQQDQEVKQHEDQLPRNVLSLTSECVTIGTKPSRRGEFQPLAPKCPLPPTSTSDETSKYHELRLERHTDHWRVLLNGSPVTSKPIDRSRPAKAIQLVVEGGQAYFADVFVYGLTAKSVN